MIGTNLIKESTKIGFGEGYATCMTIYEEKNMPMVVCFNAGNLLHVSEKIGDALPDKEYIIFADNDENEVGKDKAIQAAQKIDAEVVMPT